MKKDFSAVNNNEKVKLYIWGMLIGIIVTAVSVAAFSAAILFLKLDRIYAPAFATVSLALGSFFASRFTARRIGEKGYLVGLITGLVFFCIVTLFALVFDGNGGGFTTLFRFIIVMLASLIGGISGVNKGKNKKYI
ncbi:MAG: TIGR04086 family membrane protein [Clostridia bacterium]|nr:TIGR04086 family membrane protein [Clostridia bacterium]